MLYYCTEALYFHLAGLSRTKLTTCPEETTIQMATFSEGKDMAILQQKSKHKAKPMLACKLVKNIYIERNVQNSIRKHHC